MDLRQLRYFQAVAEELSFSKAARRLQIAQPALSRAVQDLEQRLGVTLLKRDRRSVAVTPAGAVLLDQAGLLFERIEEVVRRVQRTAVGEEGELRLGYIGPPTQNFLGRLLAEFHARHPRVNIVLEERTPERVCEMVARGRLAVGLTRPVLSGPALGLSSTLLRREPLWAALPKTHPFSSREEANWRDLAEEPLIILSRREGVGLHDAIVEACRRARFTPRIVHAPSVIGTVLAYVETGAGIGIIPDSVAVLGVGRPISFRPLVPQRAVDLVMVWSEDHDSAVAAAFRRLMLQWIAEHRLWQVVGPTGFEPVTKRL
jgi:DNA-binding transcriptional LysR family regulator